MSRIELRALVSRDGKLLFVREGAASWGLPGGELEHDDGDVDAAMDTLLRGYGVASPDIAEDFLQTAYLPEDGGQVVVNLYAPSEWVGDLTLRDGHEAGWFALDELSGVDLVPALRNLILSAFGLGEQEGDTELLAQLGVRVEVPSSEFRVPSTAMRAETAAPVAREAGRAESLLGGEGRRAAGLDVLRTLRATTDPGPAFAAMQGSTPEIAGDVVDFALGEVWSDPALDRRTRSLQVVAMLAAMGGRGGPLRSHLNGALNHGATPEQLVQTLRMVAVYAGFPAALEAWPLMEEVFKARGIERPGRLA